MGAISKRFIMIIGGFLRWVFNFFIRPKSLKLHFENADGTEDKNQSKLNFVVGICFLLALTALLSIVIKPEPREFREF
jgi:hypothetical protein